MTALSRMIGESHDADKTIAVLAAHYRLVPDGSSWVIMGHQLPRDRAGGAAAMVPKAAAAAVPYSGRSGPIPAATMCLTARRAGFYFGGTFGSPPGAPGGWIAGLSPVFCVGAVIPELISGGQMTPALL